MTHPTVQVQSNSQITDIPLTERQMFMDEHLSTSLRFFNLPLGKGSNNRGPPFLVVIRAIMYLPVPRITTGWFIYLGFYITFNTVQVISRWVVGRAEETST